MEEAFFRFEVEVVELRYFEDIVNRTMVIFEVGTGGDTDVVHIDANGSTEGFVFEYNIAIDEVHHSLKGRWGIGKSEIHDCGFKEAVSGFERCLGFVPFANADIVVSPADIELRIDVCIAEIADEIRDEGERVLISNCEGINLPVVF